MASSSQTPPQHQHHQQIWKSIVGPQKLVSDNHIPKINSLVYLFPAALLEYAGNTATQDDSLENDPILCRLLSKTYHYSENHNPYVRFLLQPADAQLIPSSDDAVAEQLISYRRKLNGEEARRHHFKSTKPLKKSVFGDYNISEKADIHFLDVANNRWPMECAVRDGCLNIYNPKWRNFLERNGIVEDDNVVFVKAGGDYVLGFMREKLSDVDKVKVLESLRISKGKAKSGEDFEVFYFPRSDYSPFVIDYDKVVESVGLGWNVGRRIRAHLTGSGVVEGRVDVVQAGVWWKSMEVRWFPNNHNIPSDMTVSPWQVEFIDEGGRLTKKQKKEEVKDSKEKEVKVFGVVIS